MCRVSAAHPTLWGLGQSRLGALELLIYSQPCKVIDHGYVHLEKKGKTSTEIAMSWTVRAFCTAGGSKQISAT